MTARTAPPAITPAPGAAGFMKTLPAPCWPTTSCGIVAPVSGTDTMLRRAPSTALRTASETSFALPVAKPTLPCPSPTATSALNEKRRPPFTTFATRLIATTFSTRSLPFARLPSRRRHDRRGRHHDRRRRDRHGRRRPPPRPPGPPRPPDRRATATAAAAAATAARTATTAAATAATAAATATTAAAAARRRRHVPPLPPPGAPPPVL